MCKTRNCIRTSIAMAITRNDNVDSVKGNGTLAGERECIALTKLDRKVGAD